MMVANQPVARVLVIAGSDSGGGAGIQGDCKTITVLGGYAATAITALTAQNTQGVFAIHEVPAEFIREQMTLVLDDIGADALKTGMLHSAEVVQAVADVLNNYPEIPLVLDPVMVAKGGSGLLQSQAVRVMKEQLVPRATLITPNIPEAEVLAEMKITSEDDMLRAAEKILRLGAAAVLLKGGHMTGDRLADLLLTADGQRWYYSERVDTEHTHGTGCAYASAIATGIGQNLPLEEAILRAHGFIHRAILNAPKLGKGHGPLGHYAASQ